MAEDLQSYAISLQELHRILYLDGLLGDRVQLEKWDTPDTKLAYNRLRASYDGGVVTQAPSKRRK